jgi:TPR repeat protein
MYKEGEGVAKNINTAITMMRKAASLGDNDAKKWLVDNGYGE